MNALYMDNPPRTITWVKTGGMGLHFTLRDENNKAIAKAFLSTEELHKFICINNKMK